MDLVFFTNCALLGVGLAMDAFSVSLVRGLSDHKMKAKGVLATAGCFAFFQALMPLIGWLCVHTVLEHFKVFERFIPWIALLLLFGIGAKMLSDGIKHDRCHGEEEEKSSSGIGALLLQGVATSIDALSVGFTIADHNTKEALICALIIAVITFAICFAGVHIGKKFGSHFAGKAEIFGGIILILIGVEIFVTGII